MMGDLVIRPLATMEEYHACTLLQEEVWGTGFKERVPAAMLMIANRLGGLAAGAFGEGGKLEGFVFGITGIAEGRLVHWSDMLAVRPGLRDRGLGTRMKLFQREVLLARGVEWMHWTFDPLQGRNAHINFAKLGIVCREYVPDMYGDTDSPLHRGIGTDRLVATWEIRSDRVRRRVVGQDPPSFPPGLEDPPWVVPVEGAGVRPIPGTPILDLVGSAVLLPVPGDLDSMMEADLPLAVRWRETTRQAFLHYISRGYEVREFLRGEEVSRYLLVWQEVGSPWTPDPGGERARSGGDRAPQEQSP